MTSNQQCQESKKKENEKQKSAHTYTYHAKVRNNIGRDKNMNTEKKTPPSTTYLESLAITLMNQR